MNKEDLQNEILSCALSKNLTERIKQLYYLFTEEELLGIAFRYAPTFHERIRLMQLLADHASPASDHAAMCIQWQKDSFARFKTHHPDEIYELRIKTSPDAWEERYLCNSFETALEMIDKFYQRYNEVETPLVSYEIEKRKILTGGAPLEEDAQGTCNLAADKVLLSLTPSDTETEFGLCLSNCLNCSKHCVSNMELRFPSCIADRSPVRYYEAGEGTHYGIHLNFDSSETLEDYYIIPFESSMLESGNYDEACDCYDGHCHIPVPHAEEVSAEALPSELRQRYNSFLDWLDKHFTKDYKRKDPK